MAEEKDFKPEFVYDGGSEAYEAPIINKLKPGDELNLTKKDPTLKHVVAGVGWDLRGFDANPPDLDLCILLLDRHNQTREDADFIFYNNKIGGDGSVRHLGDSRTGAGDGDDEQIELNLATLPFEIVKIVFVLSLYNLDHGLEGQTFSMVKNVYFRLFNQDNDVEIFRLETDELMEKMTGSALILGELERQGNEWVFFAHVDSVKGGLGKIATDCGIMITQIVQS